MKNSVKKLIMNLIFQFMTVLLKVKLLLFGIIILKKQTKSILI